MLPHVIIHNAISIDGQTGGFPVNNDLFYGVISRFEEDATLVGSGTILNASQDVPPESEMEPVDPAVKTDDSAPLLAICDSQGRIDSWHFWKRQSYWGSVLSLCSEKTPTRHLDYLNGQGVGVVKCGEEKVDLRKALEHLASEHGVKRVRVDSGGELSTALIREKLVNEISLLIHPTLVGKNPLAQLFRHDQAEMDALKLKMIHFEKMDGDVIWLVYKTSGE